MTVKGEKYVVQFEALRRGDAAVAGGKGANLGELAAAGLPVPGGFVVTANAYNIAMDRAGLRERLLNQAAAVDVNDTAQLDACSAELQALVREAGLPDGT